ncbi:MAG: GNAT family N-acetyltransferase [Oscillospiraceae bacterium]|nr:GNAT family N-acetyltransferase [Oscillospiraceae bacterium]MBQ3224657.1 GNAT family N-acetyltransferase [Oscillospiraceae bacterium]
MNIRFATERDVSKILFFIKELAEYEKMSDEVVATEDMLRKELFEKKNAEVIFALDDNENEVGFALFFITFSTFLGKPGIHLEDLYVLPEARGHGYGKALLKHLARLCVERGCGRLEWTCLNWNTPSLDFYRALGAETMDEWTSLRVSGEALPKLAEN